MQQSKWMVAALAAGIGSATGSSALAQDYVTGSTYLSNMNLSLGAYYATWAPGTPTTFTETSTGLQVVNPIGGYGSMYYPIPLANQVTLNPNDAEAVLTLTVNNVSDAQANVWIGIPFILNDNSGSYTLGGYTGSGGYVDTNTGGGSAVWNANTITVTETVLLNEPSTANLLSAIQGGGDVINGFNLELDPATYPGGANNITFNSLELQPLPEPGSLALLGVGFAGLVAFRRRK